MRRNRSPRLHHGENLTETEGKKEQNKTKILSNFPTILLMSLPKTNLPTHTFSLSLRGDD